MSLKCKNDGSGCECRKGYVEYGNECAEETFIESQTLPTIGGCQADIDCPQNSVC